MTDKPIPQFLSVEDAAKLLGVSTATLTAAIESGRLPAVRLGETHRATRINRDTLMPANESVADLRVKRLRRLTLEHRAALDEQTRVWGDLVDARRRVEETARALEHELALDEIEQKREQGRAA